MRPPLFIVITCAVCALICLSLGLLGITQEQLTTGGKLGIHSTSGVAAVVQGWLWLGAALVFLGLPASRWRFRKLLWLGLAVVYLTSLVASMY